MSLNAASSPPQAPKRPLAVTIAAWYLMLTGGLTVLMFAAMRHLPEFKELFPSTPTTFDLFQLGLGLTVQIACGFYILRGQPLARNVYLAWNGVGLLMALVASGPSMIILASLSVFALMAWAMFSPKARAFFNYHKATHGTRS